MATKRKSAKTAAAVKAAAEEQSQGDMTWQQQVEAGLTIAESVVPLLGPYALVAVGAARAIMSAVMTAASDGRDVTDVELDAIFDKDAIARMRGQAVRAAADAEARART